MLQLCSMVMFEVSQQKRMGAKAPAADIIFTGSMHTTTTQAEFLENGNNESRRIHTMSASLKDAGVNVEQAISDADAMMVFSSGTCRQWRYSCVGWD